MISNLLKPHNGTKIVIEGPFTKSGKTLLGVAMVVEFLNGNPNAFGYGNMFINHPRYRKVKVLTPNHFKPANLDKYFKLNYEIEFSHVVFVIMIDEGDINYPWQETRDNQGFWAFWGKGASHNKACVIITLQSAYHEMKRKLLHHCRIKLQGILINRDTNLPFAVAGELIYPYSSEFTQNIELALNNYDPYELDIKRIIFHSFKPERDKDYLERQNEEDSKNEYPIKKLVCMNCGHTWKPKKPHPLACPQCHKRFGYGVASA